MQIVKQKDAQAEQVREQTKKKKTLLLVVSVCACTSFLSEE
jgi:hypothetical protein